MANVFLNGADRDIETAIMLEKATIHNIGKAVAFTDGTKVFINTEDNLYSILPAYCNGMLKWLLWHERYHMELRHHNRFFKYLAELDEAETKEEFHLTKEEVNIIMDILVHDSLSRLFPELVDIALANLAQMRNRNSLGYTFTTFTLEEMLDEYRAHKNPDEEKPHEHEGEPTDETDDSDDSDDSDTEDKRDTPASAHDDKPEPKSKDKPKDKKHKKSEKKPDIIPDAEKPEEDKTPAPEPEHDKTDWSKLEDIDSKEFITKEESNEYTRQIAELKRKKFRLAKLTETLNGLTTTTRKRSYAMPSTTYCGGGVLLKGSTPGKTRLYLCFDASGSMGRELATFKDIISKSIPQAMDVPCEWFSGWGEHIRSNPEGRNSDYYKGTFKDIMPVHADSGYSDDGDRTIELCWKAEQAGYCPIGVTDGGGRISWSKDMIKQLKHTILVGQEPEWLAEVKKINPSIQTLDI